VPEDDEARREWLAGDGLSHLAENTEMNVADRFREALKDRYGKGDGLRVEHAEAVEISEYGAPLTDELKTIYSSSDHARVDLQRALFREGLKNEAGRFLSVHAQNGFTGPAETSNWFCGARNETATIDEAQYPPVFGRIGNFGFCI